jgi:3-deoxy-manno-octulosonate cytidylyltransferase (CMP-KDO synthetase)
MNSDAGLSFRVVIPARFDSTRFPGKPLVQIAGKMLIHRVFEQAAASGAREIIVATDDPRIAAAAGRFGARAVMTRNDHRSGTDRVAEVAQREDWPQSTIVVNVQGDSPLISPQSISRVARILDDNPSCDIATLSSVIQPGPDHDNPNVVKVVVDCDGRALYFSRAAIPAAAAGGVPARLRHLGIYAYRVGALQRLTAHTESCALENSERLEQLRALWLGFEIRVGLAENELGPEVDVPGDVAAVEEYLRSNPGADAENR